MNDVSVSEGVAYVYDSDWQLETRRLLANQVIWDAGTIDHLERLGVRDGWRCLEVGAGCGSIAGWLADRSGPGGRVVAADLSTERLGWLAGRGVEVWRHDVRSDPLPAEAFDLIHARMLLQHLGEGRDAVVRRLAGALRPGGFLYVEDTDPSPVFRGTAKDALSAVKAAGYQIMREAGFDDRGGQSDIETLLRCGFSDVVADGRVAVIRGGSAEAENYLLWLDYLAPRMRAAGLVGDAGIAAARRLLQDPDHRWLSQVMLSVVGRKGGRADDGH
ncbi:methyltransferase domain-containing protein [Microbispora tritici]|uniref:Methyltransferase domain-containing protein n=2 Tax=Microbispora TaxID=2005 RepID=A0ABY3LPK2_9ACTN|nr:methyltransferase domain-containing protein [Microbispora fusca]TYB43835.1 methyltransferase domain-containing protein [Microbispora tritici]